MSFKITVLVVVVLVGLGIYVFTANPTHVEGEPREVRWLISHQPVDVFVRAAEAFADVLSEESNGELKLVVVEPGDVGLDIQGDVPYADIMRLLDEGKIELGSSYTIPLGRSAPQFWSLSRPFLFDSYEEVSTYLESSEGEEILDSFAHARAIAFTMSGGFRIVASKNTIIDGLDDMTGLRIGTSGGPVAEQTISALGATPVSLDLESGPVDLSLVDGVETTYARLSMMVGSGSAYLRYLNETNHSVFLTAILASNGFYESLSPENQVALRKAAIHAAAVEREDSIALNQETKDNLVREGSIVTKLSPEVQEEFAKSTSAVSEKF